MLNKTEINIIQEGIDECQTFIKTQNRLPKSERNNKELQQMKLKSNRLKGWLQSNN